MKKYEAFSKIIHHYLNKKELDKLETYLINQSNLPGKRGNLELADAFSDYFKRRKIDEDIWQWLFYLNTYDSEKAPTNDPKEFLPFCAAKALGCLYLSVEEEKKTYILKVIFEAMNDKRWRMREAAAMAFQKIGEEDFDTIKSIFQDRLAYSNFLEKRGIIAALAHPPILKCKENAVFSLECSEYILSNISHLEPEILKTDSFKVLSKGMEYAVSVFVAALPKEGFELLKKYAVVEHKAMKKIIKSNLGKARLKKKYSEQVEAVLRMMNLNISL